MAALFGLLVRLARSLLHTLLFLFLFFCSLLFFCWNFDLTYLMSVAAMAHIAVRVHVCVWVWVSVCARDFNWICVLVMHIWRACTGRSHVCAAIVLDNQNVVARIHTCRQSKRASHTHTFAQAESEAVKLHMAFFPSNHAFLEPLSQTPYIYIHSERMPSEQLSYTQMPYTNAHTHKPNESYDFPLYIMYSVSVISYFNM